ncbi:MAG: OmpA family protein [bacterium]
MRTVITSRWRGLLALVPLCLVLTSCGVDKDKHKAQVKKAKKLEKELNQAQDAYKDQKKIVSKLHTEADGLKARAEAAEKHASKAKQEAKTIKRDFGLKLKASEKEVEELTKARLEADKRAKLLTKLTGTFQKLINKKQISLRVSHGRMVLKLRSKVLFNSGSATLANYGKTTLKHVAKALKEIKGNVFQVAGHTDNKPIKSKQFADNWELSSARAMAVVKFLLEQGVPGSSLSAAGFGEFQPVASNRAVWGRKINRRIEITLMPSIPRQLLKKPPRGRRR